MTVPLKGSLWPKVREYLNTFAYFKGLSFKKNNND